MKKILFIGSLNTKHIRRLVSRITVAGQSEFEVHFFDTGLNKISNLQDSFPFILHNSTYKPIIEKLIHIPKIGLFYRLIIDAFSLARLLKTERFLLTTLLSVPGESPLHVWLSHRYHSKTLLVPLGSDVLKAGAFTIKLQRIAFRKSDYVSADKEYRFSRDLMTRYDIPEVKCRSLGFGSEAISLICELKGKYSRQYMQEQLKLPPSNYNIVCGYTASLSQNHKEIVESLIRNLSILPKGYLVIVPLTYGKNKEQIISDLNHLQDIEKLNIVYLTDYMTAEHVSFLRLITDLFIHVQSTDAYNASLQEFILAGCQCINGRWLEYDTLEKDGLPYHRIDELNNLPQFLFDWFSGKVAPVTVPSQCEYEIRKGKEWNYIISGWLSFLKSLSYN